MDAFITFCMVSLAISLYFMPAIVAAIRENNALAVFVLNLFLGWTMVGWVVALVLAVWTKNAKTPRPAQG